MQNRSLLKLVVYSVLTLGVYGFVWLVQTRRELITATGIRIPRPIYIIATHLLYIVIGILFAYLAVLWFSPERSSGPTTISSGCWSQYTLAGAPEDINSSQNISAGCKQEINRFYQSDTEQTSHLKLYGMLFVSILFLIWAYLKWFTKYATAVEKATNRRLSATTTMIILAFLPFWLSMLIIQHAFNSQKAVPGNQQVDSALQQAANYPPIRKSSLGNILKGIGIGIAILIALIILFQQLILS